MSKGFSGVPGNMQALVKQAQKLQNELKKAQDEAQNFVAEASSGGGMVSATVNGKNELISVKIEKQVINPDDAEMLQDLIVAAVNEAFKKVQDNLKSSLEKVTGGVSIPGLT